MNQSKRSNTFGGIRPVDWNALLKELESQIGEIKLPRKLTKKEAQILRILCKNIGQVTPREIILNAVWGQDDYFAGRSMDVFITKLRKYLKEDDAVKIENIHGIGFKLSIIQ